MNARPNNEIQDDEVYQLINTENDIFILNNRGYAEESANNRPNLIDRLLNYLYRLFDTNPFLAVAIIIIINTTFFYLIDLLFSFLDDTFSKKINVWESMGYAS